MNDENGYPPTPGIKRAAAMVHTHQNTVPCKWCDRPTRMKGTKMCDPCWELEGRIHRDPDLAERMLSALRGKALVWLDRDTRTEDEKDRDMESYA